MQKTILYAKKGFSFKQNYQYAIRVFMQNGKKITAYKILQNFMIIFIY